MYIVMDSGVIQSYNWQDNGVYYRAIPHPRGFDIIIWDQCSWREATSSEAAHWHIVAREGIKNAPRLTPGDIYLPVVKG